MRRLSRKGLWILILSLLLVAGAVGVTLAYITERTQDEQNTFTPVTVDSAPVATEIGGMAVQNIGDTTAYLRAAVLVNWVAVDEEGNATDRYHTESPLAGVHYSISYDTTDAWQKGNDGFWYYQTPVEAGAITSDLVTFVTRLTEAPDGYALSVEIVTTGIQATPPAAVVQAWNVTLNGTSITPNE